MMSSPPGALADNMYRPSLTGLRESEAWRAFNSDRPFERVPDSLPPLLVDATNELIIHMNTQSFLF